MRDSDHLTSTLAEAASSDAPTFTPGPWIWGDDYRGLYGAGPDNDVLSYASYEGMWVAYGHRRSQNARLIAAAPELLEALKGLHDDVMDYITLNKLGGENNHWLVIARAAIAKATGVA